MARQKGMLNLSGNIEVNAGAPFDARDIVPTKADLTVASNFPYAYVGMETYVVAEDKKYRYMGGGVTDIENWDEVGGGGETYSDFTGATSQSAGSHGLVPAPTTGDISKFLKGDGTWATVPMPSFDYSNTSPEAMNFSTDEKVIGTWIDGKPLYQKTYHFTESSEQTYKGYSIRNLNVEYVKLVSGEIKYGAAGGNGWHTQPFYLDASTNSSVVVNRDNIKVYSNGWKYTEAYATIQYTKTTDSAVASGEKIVGQWIDGKDIYKITYDFSASPIAVQGGQQWQHVSAISTSGIDNLISCSCIDVNGNTFPQLYIAKDSNELNIASSWGTTINMAYITICYTKTSE